MALSTSFRAGGGDGDGGSGGGVSSGDDSKYLGARATAPPASHSTTATVKRMSSVAAGAGAALYVRARYADE